MKRIETIVQSATSEFSDELSDDWIDCPSSKRTWNIVRRAELGEVIKATEGISAITLLPVYRFYRRVPKDHVLRSMLLAMTALIPQRQNTL